MRRSPALPGPSPGPAPSSTSTRRPAIGAALDRDRPEVVVHAAAWTDVDGCARDPELALRAERRRDRASWRGPARSAASTSSSISTNEVFDGARTDGAAIAPTTRRARPTPTARRSSAGEQAGDRRPFDGRAPARPRDRPDGVAVRAAGPRLPGQDPRRRGAGARRRRAAPGRRRRVGHADLRRRCRRRDRRAPRRATPIARHPSPRQRPARDARGLGARRLRARPASRSTIEEVPASTWQRASTPAALGRARPRRRSRRRADPAVAGRDGRLRPAAPRPRPRRPPRDDAERTYAARRASPASATARSPRYADERGSFRELWRASRSADRRGRRRRARRAEPLRPGQPVDLGGRRPARPAPPPAPARPLGRRLRPGVRRARRRPADARRRRPAPLVETRELGADDWVDIPTGVAHGFLALEPLELLYLVTNEYDGTRRARLRLGRPDSRPSRGRRSRDAGRAADPVRARPLESHAGRARGAPRAGRLTAPAHRTGPHRSTRHHRDHRAPRRGYDHARTMLRLSRRRSAARLRLSAPPCQRSRRASSPLPS